MNRGIIRLRARGVIDEKTAKFWDDEDLNDYINQAYYFYWQKMIDAVNPGTMTEVFLDITQNSANVPLPADYVKERLIERVLSTGKTVPLPYRERFETTNQMAANAGDSYIPNHRFVGRNVKLEPTPIFSEVGGIKFTYHFVPPELTADADSPDPGLSSLFHWLLVYKTALSAKEKEEALGFGGVDMGPIKVKLNELELAFKDNIETESLLRQYTELYPTDGQIMIT